MTDICLRDYCDELGVGTFANNVVIWVDNDGQKAAMHLSRDQVVTLNDYLSRWLQSQPKEF